MSASNISLNDIKAAIANELQLSNDDLSIAQVTVTVTYKIDKQSSQNDWLDDWYEDYCRKEVVPF